MSRVYDLTQNRIQRHPELICRSSLQHGRVLGNRYLLFVELRLTFSVSFVNLTA